MLDVPDLKKHFVRQITLGLNDSCFWSQFNFIGKLVGKSTQKLAHIIYIYYMYLLIIIISSKDLRSNHPNYLYFLCKVIKQTSSVFRTILWEN